MLRGVFLLAVISAALTGLLFAATGGRLTEAGRFAAPPAGLPAGASVAPVAAPVQPAAQTPVQSQASAASDPASGTSGSEPPVGGPLVPLPNPAPPKASELSRTATAEPAPAPTPVPPPAPPLPAEPAQDLRPAQPAAPAQTSSQAALPAPVPKVKPRVLPEGTTIIYDQPKAGATKLWTGCTKFKSYDPTTETYRGLDGQLHSCKAN